MQRLQTILPAAIILVLGIWVAFISFTQEPAAAYIFPRLFSAAFVGLACIGAITALLGKSSSEQGISLIDLRNMLPGVIVACIYVFWGAKFFGFYTGTTLAVFAMLTLYDPAPHTSAMTWIKRIVITACFMAVMYGLFALILNVYTPREIFA